MSTHSTELVKGTHEFTVAGFSLQKMKGAGQSITSGVFEVGGFMEVATVEKEYLMDDRLRLHCTVEVFKETKTGATVSLSRFISVPPPGVVRHLEQLLESKRGADVTLQVETSEYDAHRAVLAARSPVFCAQFFGPMAGAGGGGGRQHVQIHDMRPPVFEAVLHFVYTDTLPFSGVDEALRPSGAAGSHHAKLMEAVAGFPREGLAAMERSLISEWLAADRFDLERMRALCEHLLWRTVGATNVAATLQLADRHHCPQLRALCVEYVASPGMLPAVVATEGFSELKEACPSLLAEVLEKLGAPLTTNGSTPSVFIYNFFTAFKKLYGIHQAFSVGNCGSDNFLTKLMF
uniref:BTB domain-containing protein n=1 Tax=Oryza brachyantha TaxID=4533 RepID=J3MSW1_ORYBR